MSINKEEDFYEKASEKHGNKFDYSLSKYNGRKKIKIRCIKHNFMFEQAPSLHLSSEFCCKLCVNEYKSLSSPLNNGREKFIELSQGIYGNKYDYSKVKYINNKTPVIIIFEGIEYKQRPDSNLQGKCIEKKWKTNLEQSEFIKKALEKHGQKYCYKQVIYKNYKEKVAISCAIHGLFEQSIRTHLRGSGCPLCTESTGERVIRVYLEKNSILYEYQKTFKECKNKYVLPFDFYLPDHDICLEFDGSQHIRPNSFFGGEIAFNKTKINDNIKTNFCKNNRITLIRLNNKKTIEDTLNNKIFKYEKLTQLDKNRKFIEKSNTEWGYKYVYSKVNYIDSKTPVIILYKGVEYLQTPSKHLQGKLCELSNNSLSRTEFLRRCYEKWGDRFDYTNTIYKNSYTNIEFYDKYLDILVNQKPTSHMDGRKYMLSKDNFVKLSTMVHDFKYDYSRIAYKRLTGTINITCPIHGEFKTSGYDHINNRMGGACKECDSYTFTKMVANFLNSNNLRNHQEHRFNDLNLPFDFYLTSLRTCIEFDGLQHFQPVEYFGGSVAYETLKINDKIKNEWCEDNYIDLIRIRYDQISQIGHILAECLKNKL